MRDGKLDFYKGLLIWSVVLGHCVNVFCPNDHILHVILRTFDLPMFMYISGFLLKGSIARYDWKHLTVNKITHIVFPAIIWSGISFVVFQDRCFYYFLWAVFISSVIICLINAFFKKLWQVMTLLLIVAVVFHLIPKNIVNISFLYPFFLIGYYSDNISKVNWGKGVVSLGIFTCLLVFVWNPCYSIWNTGGFILCSPGFMLKAVLLRLLIGMAGIYTTVFIFGYLYEISKNSALISLFEGIGKETLSLYLLQHLIVEICLLRVVESVGIGDFLIDNQNVIGFIGVPLVSLVILIIMYSIVKMLNRYRYTKWLFGFRVKLSK